MAVYETSPLPAAETPVDNNQVVNDHDTYEQQEGDTHKKTRRSRRGGYRRKRQQQKKIQALMAASAAKREQQMKETNCDNSSETSVTEEESSSCGESSSGHKSPQRVVARKKGSVDHTYENRHHPRCHPSGYHQARLHSGYPAYVYPTTNPQRKRFSRDLNKPSHQAQFVALDAEMVLCGKGAVSTLARVTLVDFHGNVIMDELVKPQLPVTDYLTFVSGITKEMLDNATMDFATARKLVIRHLKGKILVGHGLQNDLAVLGISHPLHLIRDTAMYQPFMKVRYDGCLCPRGLKDLAREKLDRSIQEYGRPHCSKEDAVAALDLYRSVWKEWESAIEYSQMNAWSMAPLPM